MVIFFNDRCSSLCASRAGRFPSVHRNYEMRLLVEMRFKLHKLPSVFVFFPLWLADKLKTAY